MDSYSEVLATEGGGFRAFFDPSKPADLWEARWQIVEAIEQQKEAPCSPSC